MLGRSVAHEVGTAVLRKETITLRERSGGEGIMLVDIFLNKTKETSSKAT